MGQRNGSWGLTPSKALTSLVHDHPVELHSRKGGISAMGEDATIEFKGYFSDVVSFSFGAKAYTLNSVAGTGGTGSGNGTAPTLEILDGTTPIGTITQGSAVVNLNYRDRTHPLAARC